MAAAYSCCCVLIAAVGVGSYFQLQVCHSHFGSHCQLQVHHLHFCWFDVCPEALWCVAVCGWWLRFCLFHFGSYFQLRVCQLHFGSYFQLQVCPPHFHWLCACPEALLCAAVCCCWLEVCHPHFGSCLQLQVYHLHVGSYFQL